MILERFKRNKQKEQSSEVDSYIDGEIRLQTRTDRLYFYSRQFGVNLVRDNNGRECLPLQQETKKAVVDSTQVDPGRDVVFHVLSTWTEKNTPHLLLDKQDADFDDIVASIKQRGHISPVNYSQLSTSTIIGHPTGQGRHAIFVFDVPNVVSWEHADTQGFSWRSSAIMIDRNKADDLFGTNQKVLDSFDKNSDERNEFFSYVPPERIQGVFFLTAEEKKIFFEISDDLKRMFRLGQGSEAQLIRKCMIRAKKMLAKSNAEKMKLFFNPHKSTEHDQALFKYAAMITRNEVFTLSNYIFTHSDELDADKAQRMMFLLRRFKPSFEATKQLQQKALDELTKKVK